MASPIPQILAIVKAAKNGKINVKREVRRHLGVTDQSLFLLAQNNEVVLTPRKAKGAKAAEIQNNRLSLPSDLADELGVQKGDQVAVVARDSAVALKKLVLETKEGDHARAEDIETPLQIVRLATTNMPPERLLPKLTKKYARRKLRHDVRKFLRGATASRHGSPASSSARPTPRMSPSKRS